MIQAFSGPYRFLSNFGEGTVTYGPWRFPYAENGYHFAKLPREILEAEKKKKKPKVVLLFQKIPPDEAKALGRIIQIRPDWKAIRLEVMGHILLSKFKDPALAKLLLDTKDEQLVEGNYWHDNFWGSCLCDQCGNAGENHLGKILMRIRDGLKLVQTFGQQRHGLSNVGSVV